MLIKNKCPLSYSLCTDTVTVYHKDGDSYTTTVYKKAFFDNKKNLSVDKTGNRDSNSFLLVIPCNKKVVHPGDKILRGVGVKVRTREEWAALIPSKIPDLVVVKYVDCKYWLGEMVHLEAGG